MADTKTPTKNDMADLSAPLEPNDFENAVIFLLTALRSDAVQGVSSADVNAINLHLSKMVKRQ